MPFSFDMEDQYHMHHTLPNKFSEECYKTHNILTLEEKVQVIRQYEQSPNYKRIAEYFHCSTTQIRNIIANKDSILLCAATNNLDGISQRTRIEKIKLLDKVMYEYILRALHQHIPINDQIVRSKAMAVKETIGIDNFCPYQIWMENFKKTYGIFTFNTVSLRRTVHETSEEHSVSCIDLIQYVSRIERKTERKKEKRSLAFAPQHEKVTRMYRRNEKNEDTICNKDLSEPKVVYENAIYGCYREFDTKADSNLNSRESMTNSLESDFDYENKGESGKIMTSSKENGKSNSTSKSERFPEITNYQEALPYLKALEEFALLESNFRAIGLITQLEQAMQNSTKT